MGQAARVAQWPVVLTIAGSDSIGGAGVQADLKVFAAMGCHGAAAITAVTAQNTHGVRAAEAVDPELLAAQIDAVAEDAPVAATKTGMLGSVEAIEAVARAVERHRLAPLVVDPVMVAKSGSALIDDAAVAALTERLLPLATLITPNPHEAARLLDAASGRGGGADGGIASRRSGNRDNPTKATKVAPVGSVEQAVEAGRTICRQFDTAICVVTGVRRDGASGEAEAVDVVCHGDHVQAIAGRWQQTPYLHGSGCAYSAAVAAALARGAELDQAMRLAKSMIAAAIAQGVEVGSGAARPVNPLVWQGSATADQSHPAP